MPCLVGLVRRRIEFWNAWQARRGERIVEHLHAAMKLPPQSWDDSLEIEVFTAEELLTTQPPEREYLIDGLPLGVVGLIVASGGVGKSFFTIDLALSVASNVPAAGGLYSVQSMGHVLLIAGEDDKDEIHRRVHAVGHKKFAFKKDPKQLDKLLEQVGSRIHIADVSSMPETFMNEGGNSTDLYDQVQESANSIEGLSLIVVDPLRRFHRVKKTTARQLPDSLCYWKDWPRKPGPLCWLCIT